jgi:hypothetical protein
VLFHLARKGASGPQVEPDILSPATGGASDT